MESGLTQLVLRAQAGDREASESLLQTLTPTAKAFAHVQCAPAVDGDDVAQEALLLVHQNLEALKHPEAVSSWLWMLTRTACSRLRRRRPARTSDVEDLSDSVEDVDFGPEEVAILHERARAVRAAVMELPEDERRVLMLRDFHGVPGKEAAERLGLTLAATKSRLHRARQRLRGDLATRERTDVDPQRDACFQLSLFLEGDLSTTACDALKQRLRDDPQFVHECDAVREMIALCREVGWPEGRSGPSR